MAKDEVLEKLKQTAKEVYESIEEMQKPSLNMPVRSLSNVKYDSDDGYFELDEKEKRRTLSANTIKTFAQTLRLMSEAKNVVENDDMMTKREAYYVSKNWEDAKFEEQKESDTVLDDIEAMIRVNREQLGFNPEEKGGDVAGDLIVIDEDESGDELRIDCTKFGSGAYSVPTSVEHLEFETDADFVMAIETAGMFQRLVSHGFWDDHNCILVSMGGVPTRATRRFIRRLSDSQDIPVYVFTDADPYGTNNIYRTLKVGSGNAAHINEFFCVPRAQFIGVTPSDIENYDLPTHPLRDVDIKRIEDALDNDPFVHHHEEWQEALKKMKKMGVRAEQQSLARHGLNYVISDYLPEKLDNPNTWLP